MKKIYFKFKRSLTIVIFLLLLLTKGGYSTLSGEKVIVSKSGQCVYFCNEGKEISVESIVKIYPYIKLNIDHTNLEVVVYRQGFYQTYLANILVFSNIDVGLIFEGVENLKREDNEPGEIIVDYIWEGFVYSGTEAIDGEHPLNWVYTYLPGGEGSHIINIDGEEVKGAYLLPLKIRFRVGKEDLLNKWFSDPGGFIMTVIPAGG